MRESLLLLFSVRVLQPPLSPLHLPSLFGFRPTVAAPQRCQKWPPSKSSLWTWKAVAVVAATIAKMSTAQRPINGDFPGSPCHVSSKLWVSWQSFLLPSSILSRPCLNHRLRHQPPPSSTPLKPVPQFNCPPVRNCHRLVGHKSSRPSPRAYPT